MRASLEQTETPTVKFVERKNESQLTEEERNIILANARAGVEQPNFDVTFFKNGNFKITKRKAQALTVAQKVIKPTPPAQLKTSLYESTTANTPAFYTEIQILYEVIIELTSKAERVRAKHKNLKHKYKDPQHNLYIDDNDDEVTSTRT